MRPARVAKERLRHGSWTLSGGTPAERGFEFQARVADVLAADFPSAEDVRIRATPINRTDGGLDIEIRATADFLLFDRPYAVARGREDLIHIDCKYTDGDTLDWERLAPSVDKTAGKGVSCFVVVTNARLGAKAYCVLLEAFRRIGVKFLAAERDLVASWLARRDALIGTYEPPPLPPDGVTVERQTVTQVINDRIQVQFYVRVDNNTATRQPCRLLLAKNTPWRIEADAPPTGTIGRKLFVEPYGTTCLQLLATSVANIDTKVMSAAVEWSGGTIPVDVVARDVELQFEPQFLGEGHARLRDAIAASVLGTSGFACINVVGDAGTGKTRVIQEALRAARSNVTRVARVVIDAGTPAAALAGRIDKAVTDALSLKRHDPADDLDGVLRWIVDSLAHPRRTLVLVLEDLHHAPPELFATLRALFARSAERSSRLVVILSGRNDFTFLNKEYYFFVDEVDELRPPTFEAHTVLPLTADDAATLVANTVRGIPAFAVRRICRLAGNIPFNLVQCIEFLLDQELAVVLNRNTVGIVDLRGFASRLGLPKSMAKVFELRFDSLAQVEGGRALQDVLLLAAFLGFNPPERVLDYGGRDRAEVKALLASRRFVRLTNGIEWVHENLLHFVRGLAAERAEEARIARLLFRDEELLAPLDELRRGEIASIASEYEVAAACYAPMLTRVASVTNFSTMDVPTAYYDHVEHAFRTVSETSRDSDLLSRLLKVGCWIGSNGLSIVECQKAAAFARRVLPEIDLDEDEAARLSAWIKQIEAHSQIDSGWTAAARKNLLELECDLQTLPALASDPLLRFDLYNRLQAMYGVYNHLNLVVGYGDLAMQAARDSGDQSLETKQILDDAIWYQFIDHERCRRQTLEGLRLNETHGTDLHTLLGRLSLIAAEMPLHAADDSWLTASIAEVHRYRDRVFDAQLWPVIPRIYLGLSALYVLAARTNPKLLDLALHYVDAGLEASVKYTIGFTVWQLQNMKAIIVGRLDSGNVGAIEENLETAMAQLQKEDLLFLGSLSFTCVNMLVITNYLRHCARERPSEVDRVLLSLKGYGGPPVQGDRARSQLLKTLFQKAYHVAFYRRPNPASVVVDETTGLAFSVAF
jgi:hypothetical protein